MAAGRVAIGFSKPYVADYVNNSGTISFANARVLARGVGVQIDPDTSDDNVFYADNQAAEADTGSFTGGSITLTVDGLFTDAARFLYGLAPEDASGWVAYDDRMAHGYKAIGYIGKYMSDAVISYVPTIIVKTSFNQPGEELNTQEDEIDWQTTELSGRILRGDDEYHTWRFITEEGYATEAEAEAALVAKLGGTAELHTVTQNLTNVVSSYNKTSILDGANFAAFLTGAEGYTVDTVTVTLDAVDVTSTAWNSTQGVVTIPAVDGDIVITATGTT